MRPIILKRNLDLMWDLLKFNFLLSKAALKIGFEADTVLLKT